MQTTKRAGWVRRGVPGPESVADHMYRMGVMALVAADLPAGVNRDRCVDTQPFPPIVRWDLALLVSSFA